MRTKSIKILQVEKGFVLALTMVVLLSLATFSIAMMGILQKNSDNRVRANQVNTVSQAAEFGVESGRLWLVDQLTRAGTDAIVITNTESTPVTGDCLGVHGYTNTSNFIHYSYRQTNQTFASGTGETSNFGRYGYEFYVQRIGNHTTLNGWNYIPQDTQGEETITPNTYNNRRIFYRVLSCGFGPGNEKIVPLQGFFSAGGDGATGNVARSLNVEGFYRP